MHYTKQSENDIKIWLKENLTYERYEHSVGTAECARDLAVKYNLDQEKAYIAGLLHDCAKCFPYEKAFELINNSKISLVDEEKYNKKTIHAPVSAYFAESYFGVSDNEILSAIRWHTLGNINMSLFEKIIFLADKIEMKTRDEAYSNSIRQFVNSVDDINRALLECYKKTIISLVNRDLKICPLTIEIYNNLESKISS